MNFVHSFFTLRRHDDKKIVACEMSKKSSLNSDEEEEHCYYVGELHALNVARPAAHSLNYLIVYLLQLYLTLKDNKRTN